MKTELAKKNDKIADLKRRLKGQNSGDASGYDEDALSKLKRKHKSVLDSKEIIEE